MGKWVIKVDSCSRVFIQAVGQVRGAEQGAQNVGRAQSPVSARPLWGGL